MQVCIQQCANFEASHRNEITLLLCDSKKLCVDSCQVSGGSAAVKYWNALFCDEHEHRDKGAHMKQSSRHFY